MCFVGRNRDALDARRWRWLQPNGATATVPARVTAGRSGIKTQARGYFLARACQPQTFCYKAQMRVFMPASVVAVISLVAGCATAPTRNALPHPQYTLRMAQAW